MKNFIAAITTLACFFLLPGAYASAQTVNKIVAVVNEEVVTQQDVDQLKTILYAQYAQEFKGNDLLKKMREVEGDLLRQIIEDKLVLSRAKELNVRATDNEIEDKLKLIKSSFPSDEVFNETLMSQGVTVADLKDRYRDQIIMRKIVEFGVKSKVSVLPSDVTKYYEDHRQEFKIDEKYKVRHILIKADSDVDAELAKVETGDIYDDIVRGRDFAELAKEYSQGPHKEQGGDMGYLSRGTMLKELDDAIFLLKPGEFSPPIRSDLGYHIFKVEDATNSGYMSLDGAKQDIEKILFQKKFKEKLDEWLSELKAKAYISIK
ncbi:MAG: peptidylprolyl isomerase [Candidatus Omnitrophica bacterium]|nr:peptidylprolyl isomerase [Candidatus Omnitrophota bacterium]